MSRSSVVEKNFSAAASTYDSAASFQRIAAGLFADFIRRHESGHAPASSVLELGAGSGLLTAHLTVLFPDAALTVSDLSDKMLDVCRAKFSAVPRISFERADFNQELKSFQRGFDAVLSSMAMHWAEDFDIALRNAAATLRSENSRFYLCLPLAESTEKLKKLFESEALSFPGLELPRLESIIPHLSRNGFSLCAYQTEECSETYSGLAEFLRSFQLTGTGRISGAGMRPSDLRRLLRKNERVIENKYKFAFFICEVKKEK